MMDYMNRLADTKSRISRLGAMRESIRKQTASLAQELIEAEDEGRHLDEEYAEARADKEALLKHKAEFETAGRLQLMRSMRLTLMHFPPQKQYAAPKTKSVRASPDLRCLKRCAALTRATTQAFADF